MTPGAGYLGKRGKGYEIANQTGKNPRLVGLYFSEIGQKLGNLGLFSHTSGW